MLIGGGRKAPNFKSPSVRKRVSSMLEVTIMWESEHRALGALASLWEHVILGKAGGPVLEHGHCWTFTADPWSGFGE